MLYLSFILKKDLSRSEILQEKPSKQNWMHKESKPGHLDTICSMVVYHRMEDLSESSDNYNQEVFSSIVNSPIKVVWFVNTNYELSENKLTE
jgi:hypothetical protein